MGLGSYQFIKNILLCVSLISTIGTLNVVSCTNMSGNNHKNDEFLMVQRDDVNMVLHSDFMKEHNMNHLATIHDYTIYTISGDNYAKYYNTLRSIFYIEYNQVIKLDYKESKRESKRESKKENLNKFIVQSSDGSINLSNLNVEPSPWHLDRIDKTDNTPSGTYKYNATGSCHTDSKIIVDTYVVDTGIDIDHPQFNGRAKWLANFADNDDTDCQSHGTHCSGIIGSEDYGVCKDANLYAIKVLDCSGSGTLSGVIKGIEYAYDAHVSKVELMESSGVTVKSIISMSLGGGFSRIVNRAVELTLEKSDSFYIVAAAGNEDNDSCRTSPASANGVLTVMASDISDKRAYFSNWGTCADIYAPGVAVTSTVPNGKVDTYSGTSMACPVVAGVLNHYLHMYPEMSRDEVKNKMFSDANKNLIKNNKKRTKNLLVYLNH